MKYDLAKFMISLLLSSVAVGIYYYANKNYYNDETDKFTLIKTFAIYFIVSNVAICTFDYMNSCGLSCMLSGSSSSPSQFGGTSTVDSSINDTQFLTKSNIEKFKTGAPPF